LPIGTFPIRLSTARAHDGHDWKMNPPNGVNLGKDYLELNAGDGDREQAPLRDQNCSLG